MEAMELLRNQAVRLKDDIQQAGTVGLSTPALLTVAEVAIHFMLAAVLSGGVLFNGYSPLGVAAVAGAGAGLCGGGALLGAGLGYLTLLGFSDGLRYLSAAILTFAVGFAFHDVEALRRPLSLPVAAGAMVGVTGYIYLSQLGWRTQDVIFLATEIGITILVGWGYRLALLPVPLERGEGRNMAVQRMVAASVLLCAILVALADVGLAGDMTLGRVAGGAVVMAAGWRLGSSYGAALGVVVGLALDLSALGTPLYAMALGMAGLAAGGCRGKNRLWALLAFVGAGTVSLLWTWSDGLKIGMLYEILSGGLALCLLPTSWLRQLDGLRQEDYTIRVDSGNLQRVGRRLEGTATAFRSITNCLRQSGNPPQNDNDIATIFDRTAQRVCRGCALRDNCWEKHYNDTFRAMNDATPAILERGSGRASDFPPHFVSRCIHLEDFIHGVNGELTALLYRRQYQSRIQESRRTVCRQYAQLATLLDEAAVELSRELVPDDRLERKLRHHLMAMDMPLEAAVFRDCRGLIRVELKGERSHRLGETTALRGISALMRVPLRSEEHEEGLTLYQMEPLMAVAGVAARKKSGETVSGDAGSYFKSDDGMLYLLLCDGMGSGVGAHQESGMAVRLLEQFLKAGVGAEQALITLSSALGLRGEEGGGFTTVDLLQIDLFTGEGGVYKLGAAPTYVKKGDEIQKIVGSALPAGLDVSGDGTPDYTRLKLEVGDTVLMVSDGVASPQEDGWLISRFGEFCGDSPKELARMLVQEGGKSATDDKTALVVTIGLRVND